MDDNWEVEKQLLETKVKDLEKALDKSKKLHRKFVEDVIDSEELRNQDFDRLKKELVAVNKRQATEIRELTKDTNFYEATCNALMKETSTHADNLLESSSRVNEFPQTTDTLDVTANQATLQTGQATIRNVRKVIRSGGKYKISTKLFEENKKIKQKNAKLTAANAHLRLRVKQLEHFKNKCKKITQQQVADQQELHNLLTSTTRTNREIFSPSALSQLGRFSLMRSKNDQSQV